MLKGIAIIFSCGLTENYYILFAIYKQKKKKKTEVTAYLLTYHSAFGKKN